MNASNNRVATVSNFFIVYKVRLLKIAVKTGNQAKGLIGGVRKSEKAI